MKAGIKFYFFLAVLFLALTGTGYLVTGFLNPGIEFRELIILLAGATIITGITFYIFYAGMNREKSKPVIFTLAAIGLKFLFYLALLGIYALLSRNLSIPFLLSFFIIYLVNTSYLLFTFVNLLKSKKQTVQDINEK